MTTDAHELARLRTLPRAEVHVHLEGCFEASMLEQWAGRFKEPIPRPRERLFQFDGLADILHFLDWACGLVRTPEELAESAYDFSRRLAASGTGYADLIFNPTHWSHWNGSTP